MASKHYETGLTKINQIYTPMIANQLQVNGIQMTDYQKTCVIAALKGVNALLTERGESVTKFDQNNLTEILLSVAALQLNADASPREVYFIVRNHKRGDGPKVPQLEMGIEGDGNDAILSRFGRDIKQVFPFWKVRENDKFSYPKHNGLKLTDPEWEETGQGKVIRVVYPIQHEDDSVDYYIGEREDVKANLLAHVANNLMWDKGGAKAKFKEKAENMTLDEILNDKDLVTLGKISPAWSEPQSREAMILRKMRNNVVKKIPKDFGSALVATQYEEQSDGALKQMRRDVTENANQTDFELPDQTAPELPEHTATAEHPATTTATEPVKAETAPQSEAPAEKKEADPF